MRFKQLAKHFKNYISSIGLIDLFLVILMSMLLLQSAHSMFVNEIQDKDTNAIDTVIRTTSASVFGYFIGKKPTFKNEYKSKLMATPSKTKNEPKAQIGFSKSSDNLYDNKDNFVSFYGDSLKTDKFHVTTVFLIGAFCLLVLIIARNFPDSTSSTSTASLSQFRDYLSGCVGFLVAQAQH